MAKPELDIMRRFGKTASGEPQYSVRVAAQEPSLGDPEVEERRRWFGGGQLTPISRTQLRWYPADVEIAMRQADGGNLGMAARLWSACQHDGVVSGVLSTRTDGLVRLPKAFTGNEKIVRELESSGYGLRNLFDEMFPPSELAALVADGIGLGVGVGELVAVEGREFPVLVRLEPEFLSYRFSTNTWHYQSNAGNLQVNPGDGRWILHLPGARVNPWRKGAWTRVGDPWIRKTHAAMYDLNWISKLAHPARVATSPVGSTRTERQNWFKAVMAWGKNTVFGMPPGYKVELLESNGRGHESFSAAIERAEREIIIALAGQEITTDGGQGFQNNDIHQTIKSDLIQATADQLAFTLNTQGIAAWAFHTFGYEALDNPALVSWDVTPPQDLKSLADAYRTLGFAFRALVPELARYGLSPDVQKIVERFNVPVLEDPNALNLVKLLIEAQGGSGGGDGADAGVAQ